MTKTIPALVLLAAALPTLASAGEIYGKVSAGGAAVPEGTTVEARCGAKAYPAAKTDKSGSYRVEVAETGRCTLTISLKEQSASIEILVYDEGAQADLVLETKDGKLTARRR